MKDVKERFKITVEVESSDDDGVTLVGERVGFILHSPRSKWSKPLTDRQMSALTEGVIQFTMTHTTNLRKGKQTVIKTGR